MRTLMFIGGGILLWLAFALVTKLAGAQPENRWLLPAAFGVIWFAVAAWNMWVGVTAAGYSFWVELPIFLLIFATPVVVAVLSVDKFRG